MTSLVGDHVLSWSFMTSLPGERPA